MGYVGESISIAGEYHKPDFDWEILKNEGEARIQRQRQEWAGEERKNSTPATTSNIDTNIASTSNHENKALESQGQTDLRDVGDLDDLSSFLSTSGLRNEVTNVHLPGRENFVGDPHYGDGWEAFHKRHGSARFFKEKRYIPLAFPMLLESPPPGQDFLHVAEIGCGCGSALLPVLKANPDVKVTACDLSPTAVELFKAAADRAGIDPGRINAFPFDASMSNRRDNIESTTANSAPGVTNSAANIVASANSNSSSPLAGLGADCLLMVYTLSALWPHDMLNMLQQAYDALKPGGFLLFRDYGLYDMTQLRAHGRKLLDPEELVYQRLDGTLSYYFSKEKIVELTSKVGFELHEFEYATTLMINRKNGAEMRRVYATAVFKKA